MVYNGNPIKMDDLGVPLFLETPIFTTNLKIIGKRRLQVMKLFWKKLFWFTQCKRPGPCLSGNVNGIYKGEVALIPISALFPTRNLGLSLKALPLRLSAPESAWRISANTPNRNYQQTPRHTQSSPKWPNIHIQKLLPEPFPQKQGQMAGSKGVFHCHPVLERT